MQLANTTFLVVEDNDLDVEKIMRGFSRAGITNSIVRVRNGVEAFDVICGRNGRRPIARPFVVLLDINLPKMNGIEFLAEFRSDCDNAHMPVLVVSTSNNQDDIESTRYFGACGYVVKPIEIDDMLDQLGAVGVRRVDDKLLQMGSTV